jgi:acetyl esterase/lipase
VEDRPIKRGRPANFPAAVSFLRAARGWRGRRIGVQAVRLRSRIELAAKRVPLETAAEVGCNAAMSPAPLLLALLAAGPERLWPAGAPGGPDRDEADRPALTAVLPDGARSAGAAVVICPGGSYQRLAQHEGEVVARWFAERGVAAFVLTYRLGPRHRHPAQLEDVKRALRTVRARAAALRVAPGKIGVVGFSAGGHLASMASTLFDDGDPKAADPIDRVSSRPDFAVLAYPVITLTGPASHEGSRRALLGDDPAPDLLERLSTNRLVSARTPPTFLFHTGDDPRVLVDNSVLYYQALRQAGVPAELHAYEHGRHGVGLAAGDPVLSSWTTRLEDWLRQRGVLASGRGPAPPPAHRR